MKVILRFYMVILWFYQLKQTKYEKHQKCSGGNLMKETTHLLVNFDLREIWRVSTYSLGSV